MTIGVAVDIAILLLLIQTFVHTHAWVAVENIHSQLCSSIHPSASSNDPCRF